MPQLRSLKVILIRHGESQDNSDGIWAGFKDSPLTPLGLAQAKALGKSFSNVPLVGIYCSDLKRAAVTANEILVANTTQPPPLLVQSQSLREQNFGVAEGKSWADKDALQLAQASTGEDARDFRFQGGETLEEVNRRMATSVRRFVLPRVEALRQEASKSSSNGGTELSVQPHICIVAHGIAIAELLRVFMSLHDSNYSNPDTTASSSSNSQPWPWENPTLTYNRVRLENTGYTDIEISIPIGDSSSGLAPISNPISRSNSPIPSTSPLPSSSFRNPDESSQADISTTSLNQDVFSTSQARAAPPLSLQPSTSFSPIPSKSLFVRILSQNNIEHLRGVSAPATIGKVKGKASSVAASILGGGSSSSGLTSSTTSSSLSSNANLPLPQTPSTGNSGGFPSRSPGAQSSFAASPAVSTTPSAATARSLGAYDAKVMAREMEKGQGGMLAGGIPLSAGIGSPSSGTNTHGGDLSATSASGLGLGLGIASSNGGNSYNSNESRSLNSYQMPSSASALYNVFPAGNPNISSTGSGSGSASGAGGVGKISFSTEEREVWNSVSLRVLPLFNGEGLRSHLEDINESVSQHVQATVKRTPGRALDALSADLSNLVNSGMLTLTTKLADAVSAVQSQASRSSGELEAKADERLLTRLVELWTMFWSSVLPYLEGCFLPFHTNQDLVSLTSSAKAANAARSTVSTAGLRTEKIDTRKVILTVFRDAMILPIVDRLFYLFANIRQFQPGIANDYGLNSSKSHRNGSSSSIGINSSSNTVADESAQLCPRLLQMTSVLSSILSNDPAQHAIDALLRALRVGNAAGPESMGDGDRSKASGVGNQQANKNRHGWLPKSAIKHGKGASPLSNPLTSSPRMNINNLNLSQSQSTLVNNLGDERPQYASYYDDMTSSLGSGTIGRTGGETPSNLRGFSIDSSRDPSSYSNSNAYGISRVPLMTEDDYLSSLKSPVHSPGQSVTSGNSPSPGANNQQPLDQADAKTSSLRAPSLDSGRGSSRPTSSQAGDEFHDASAGSPAIPLEALKTTGIGNEDEEGDFEPFPTPTTSSVSALSPYPQAMNSPTAATSTLTPTRPPRRQSSAASSPTAASQRSPVPPLPRSPNRYSPGNRNANPNQGSPFFNSGVNLSPVSHSHSQSSPSPINPSSSNAQQPHPLSLTRRASDFTTTSPSSEPSLSQDLDSKLFDSTREEIDTSDISTEQDKERARALLSSFEGTWEDVQNALDS